MINQDAIEKAITLRIRRLEREIIRNERLSAVFLTLSVAPFLALCWIAFAQFDGGLKQEVSLLALVVAAIGLTFVIWNIGGTFRYQQRRSEVERDRLENLRLSFLVVPPDRMEPRDLLMTVNQLSGDLWPFVRHSLQRTDIAIGSEPDPDLDLIDYEDT